jgi:hypothetical protein
MNNVFVVHFNRSLHKTILPLLIVIKMMINAGKIGLIHKVVDLHLLDLIEHGDATTKKSTWFLHMEDFTLKLQGMLNLNLIEIIGLDLNLMIDHYNYI